MYVTLQRRYKSLWNTTDVRGPSEAKYKCASFYLSDLNNKIKIQWELKSMLSNFNSFAHGIVVMFCTHHVEIFTSGYSYTFQNECKNNRNNHGLYDVMKAPSFWKISSGGAKSDTILDWLDDSPIRLDKWLCNASHTFSNESGHQTG